MFCNLKKSPRNPFRGQAKVAVKQDGKIRTNLRHEVLCAVTRQWNIGLVVALPFIVYINYKIESHNYFIQMLK